MPKSLSESIRLPWLLFALLFALLSALASTASAATPDYRVDYRVGFMPDDGIATVAINITPGSGRAQRLRFSIDGKRHHAFDGDGRLDVEGETVTWRPPKSGGTLRYRYRVDRKRAAGEYDARMTADWALLRIDRLIPSVAVLAPYTRAPGVLAAKLARLERDTPAVGGHA